MPRSIALAVLVLCLSTFALADSPSDNIPENVRRVPKLGIEVPEEKRKDLEAFLAKLRSDIDDVKKRGDYKTRELWPGVIRSRPRFVEGFQ
jgi:hypothetical protein